jgi:predicted extracellular nuclease
VSRPWRRVLASALAVCLSIGALSLGTAPAVAVSTELFFSEYIEGSSNNKALEIYNDTGAAVNLATGAYNVQFFFNGSSSPLRTISLTGAVAAGDVYVLAQASAAAAILAEADQTDTSTSWFNGDDAVVLRKGTTVVDSIGQVGFDPGSQWGTGDTSTENNTIRRKASVTAGDTVATDPFDPSAEWIGFPQDTFNGIGYHPGVKPLPPADGACGDPATLIHEIQGMGTVSPVAGQARTVEGVVIGDLQSQFSGYHLQEENSDEDGDPLTSEGLFIFNTDPVVEVGDLVRVTGTVGEFPTAAPNTQITPTGVTICSSGSSVTATDVDLPVAAVADLERYESMLVSFDQELTVTEVFALGRFGEVMLSSNGRQMTPTAVVEPGAPAQALQALNDRSRIVLDDGINTQNIDPTVYPQGGLSASNTLRVGDSLAALTGVLEQRFSVYRIQPVGAIAFDHDNARPAAPAEVGGRLRISAMNVLNYFTTFDTTPGSGNGPNVCGPTGGLECRGANNAFEFERQRTKIISALVGLNADIVGLMEIQNDAGASVADLVAGLNDALGAGTYDYIDTGTIGTDAIKVALIYKPGTVTPVRGHAILDSTVDPRFDDTRSRPALAQTFKTRGGRLTVVVNHLKSKGSACAGDPDTGDGSGNCNLTRTAAAEALVDWLATDPTNSHDSDFLVIGDLNSYAKEDPIDVFVGAGYTDVLAALAHDPYSFVFQGQSGYLDHALASASLLPQITGATDWHINADEPTVLDYNTDFKSAGHVASLYAPDAYRSSDHDPLVVGLWLNGPDDDPNEPD